MAGSVSDCYMNLIGLLGFRALHRRLGVFPLAWLGSMPTGEVALNEISKKRRRKRLGPCGVM